MTALGEIRVEEREGCVALIVRTTDRWRPWDVWTIVEVPNDRKVYDEYDAKDLIYGHSAFRAVRGLERFYCHHITYFAAKRGSRRKQESAEKLARKHLDKFLRWRDEQRRIATDLEGGVTLVCEECGASVKVDAVDGILPLEPMHGWQVAPRRLCPEHAD